MPPAMARPPLSLAAPIPRRIAPAEPMTVAMAGVAWPSSFPWSAARMEFGRVLNIPLFFAGRNVRREGEPVNGSGDGGV